VITALAVDTETSNSSGGTPIQSLRGNNVGAISAARYPLGGLLITVTDSGSAFRKTRSRMPWRPLARFPVSRIAVPIRAMVTEFRS
jgi:hypothetical protein